MPLYYTLHNTQHNVAAFNQNMCRYNVDGAYHSAAPGWRRRYVHARSTWCMSSIPEQFGHATDSWQTWWGRNRSIDGWMHACMDAWVEWVIECVREAAIGGCRDIWSDADTQISKLSRHMPKYDDQWLDTHLWVGRWAWGYYRVVLQDAWKLLCMCGYAYLATVCVCLGVSMLANACLGLSMCMLADVCLGVS